MGVNLREFEAILKSLYDPGELFDNQGGVV
jgi:hypothetical protein